MLVYLLTLLEDEHERSTLAAIYHTYHVKLEKVALHILQDQKDTEDAVQNTFLQVIKHIKKLNEIPCEELPYWLISIVKNEALMIARKRRTLVPLDDWDGFSQTVDADMGYQQLVELFTRLPEGYRAVLEMKLLLGYSDREIAQHLNLTETAVSTRAGRGRELLRQLVEKEGLHL